MHVHMNVFLLCAWHRSGYDTSGTKHEDSLGHNSLADDRGGLSSGLCMRPFPSSDCSGMCGSQHRRTRNDYLLVGVFADVSPSNSWDSEICFRV